LASLTGPRYFWSSLVLDHRERAEPGGATRRQDPPRCTEHK